MKHDTLVFACAFTLALAALASTACAEKKPEAPRARETLTQLLYKTKLANEIAGFGSLSFTKKVDVEAAASGRVARLCVREGGEVREGALLAVLENPQLELAAERAEHALSTARAALELARAALRESECDAEARLLGIAKAEAELRETWKTYYENERKFNAQTTLYFAGGVNEESMRIARFALESELARLHLGEKELEIRKIGFRASDLEVAGIAVPADNAQRQNALITLASGRARAELHGALARENAALKELESVRLERAELAVYSPAAGIIAARAVEEGERVKPGDTLFRIIDSGALYAGITVREADAFRLERGMEARVRIDGTETEYTGAVDLISPVADAASFSFSVRILLPKEALLNSVIREGSLFAQSAGERELARPGMFARAVIRLGADRELCVISEHALINRKNEEASCWVVQNGALVPRKLTLGGLLTEQPPDSEEDARGGRYIVEAGIEEGERVVLYPDASLQEGEYVQIAQ